MKNYIRSIEMKGGIKEIIHTIEDITNDNPFVIDATTFENLNDPNKINFLKNVKGKKIISLAQDIVDMITDFYTEE